MGYVNNTQMSLFIPPANIQKTAGTWTPTLTSNVLADVRTAADASFTLFIPIPLPANAAVKAGAKLKSIDVYYKILTAAADDFATVELEKMALKATGSIPTGAAVTTTEDSGHDAAAERKATGDHTMTVTITSPAYLDEDDHYVLELIVDAAATTVFSIYGARANYELRI